MQILLDVGQHSSIADAQQLVQLLHSLLQMNCSKNYRNITHIVNQKVQQNTYLQQIPRAGAGKKFFNLLLRQPA